MYYFVINYIHVHVIYVFECAICVSYMNCRKLEHGYVTRIIYNSNVYCKIKSDSFSKENNKDIILTGFKFYIRIKSKIIINVLRDLIYIYSFFSEWFNMIQLRHEIGEFILEQIFFLIFSFNKVVINYTIWFALFTSNGPLWRHEYTKSRTISR